MTLFNKIAHRYDDWYQTPRGAYVDTIQKELIREAAGVAAGESVLDLGCGTGNYTLALARYGCQVTGADISEGMLAAAKKKADSLGLNIKWVQADFANLPFPDGTFDLVVTVTALEFVADPRGGLLEAMRVLKPGGRLVVGVLSRDSAWGAMYLKEARDNPDSVFAAARLYSALELSKFLPGCRNIKGGLFIPPGPPEIDFAEAERLENAGRTEYAKAGETTCNPGFLVARWDKPATEGPQLACQIALYPLGTSQVNEDVNRALKVLHCYPVSYQTNGMSTLVGGSDQAVWTALQAFADRSMEGGRGVVINVVISNRCNCPSGK